MSLVEALTAVQLLVDMVPGQRHQLSSRMIHYFFLNPVEICLCPFYYQQQAEQSRQAKGLSQEQWQRLGISLPQAVVDFHPPYCPYVEVEGEVPVDDEHLLQASDTIEAISGQLAPWHDSFRQRYFSDLSFLLVSNVLGSQEAIRLKFEIVRDFLSNGKKERLTKIIEDIFDKLDDFF
jgi:hypothetical protein